MKKVLIISLGMIALISFPVFSQESELEFGGYLEDTLSSERNIALDKTVVSNQTRIRLNIKNSYGDRGDLSVAIVGTRYSGYKTINLCDYLPEEEASRFPTAVSYDKTDDIWFQEAYGSLYLGQTTLRAGRQKYYTGTGYAWNPTDLFNWKDVFDPAYEIEGLDSVLFARSLPGDSLVSLYYSFGTSHDRPQRDYVESEDGDYQFKLKTHLFSWEITLQHSDVIKEYVDYEGVLNGTVDPTAMTSPIRWKLNALEVSGELAGIGIHAEGGEYTLSRPDDKDGDLPGKLESHTKYLVGADYTFENGVFVILEYYHEGLGETNLEDYSLNQRMAYYSGERDSLGKDNYYLGTSFPVTDFSTLALYVITNGNDGSTILNPWFTWIADDDISLYLSAQIPDGEEESAIGRSGSVLFGRLVFNF